MSTAEEMHARRGRAGLKMYTTLIATNEYRSAANEAICMLVWKIVDFGLGRKPSFWLIANIAPSNSSQIRKGSIRKTADGSTIKNHGLTRLHTARRDRTNNAILWLHLPNAKRIGGKRR